MRGNFEKILDHVFEFEGGYVNDPDDPGGETNFGISKRAYPGEDIKNMTRKRAAEIYRRDYWNAVRGDDLPSGLDFVTFDGAVNSGVSRGAKWLQLAIGADADGKVGNLTIERAKAVNPTNAINAACMRRLSFMQSLSGWQKYGRGWQRRVDAVRVAALEMADRPPRTNSDGLASLIAAIIDFLKQLFGANK